MNRHAPIPQPQPASAATLPMIVASSTMVRADEDVDRRCCVRTEATVPASNEPAPQPLPGEKKTLVERAVRDRAVTGRKAIAWGRKKRSNAAPIALVDGMVILAEDDRSCVLL